MSLSNGGSTTIKSAEIESIVWDHVKSQLELKGVQWIPARFNQLNSVNSRFNCSEDKRKKILRILGLMSNDLLNKNRDFLRSKCETVIERLDQLNSDQLDALGYISFCEIADALFSKGIRWNHILVLFVFSVELSFIYSRIKDNLILIDKVTDWLLQYLSDRLLVWINNNNGWDGLISYYNDHNGTPLNRIEGGQWQKVAVIGGVIALALYYFTSKH